jgi:pyruvate kinase
MVARGDLGVELPFEEVPLAQKRIIQAANFHARPVITATQMLESMLEHSRPTRAEASDVANAVLDGTDAVMLSGETAIGRYPLLALDAIVRIVREIESSGVLERGPRYLGDDGHESRRGASVREHAVASATVDALRHLDAPAVLVITRSGFSARLVSSHRPPVPIFAVTTDPTTYRQLSAVWGVRPLLARGQEVSYESLSTFGMRAILEAGVGSPGDSVAVTAGFPFHEPGTTNTLRVERL